MTTLAVDWIGFRLFPLPATWTVASGVEKLFGAVGRWHWAEAPFWVGGELRFPDGPDSVGCLSVIHGASLRLDLTGTFFRRLLPLVKDDWYRPVRAVLASVVDLYNEAQRERLTASLIRVDWGADLPWQDGPTGDRHFDGEGYILARRLAATWPWADRRRGLIGAVDVFRSADGTTFGIGVRGRGSGSLRSNPTFLRIYRFHGTTAVRVEFECKKLRGDDLREAVETGSIRPPEDGRHTATVQLLESIERVRLALTAAGDALPLQTPVPVPISKMPSGIVRTAIGSGLPAGGTVKDVAPQKRRMPKKTEGEWGKSQRVRSREPKPPSSS